MTTQPAQLHPAAAKTLTIWHDLVARRDFTELDEIVHPQAVFRSPMAFNPYSPAPALLLALRTVITIFEDFAYHRQFASSDGLNVVLEFSGKVNGKGLKGVDLIQFDEAGLIVEFEVMVRPLNALQELGAEMGARLAGRLPAFKGKA